MLRRRTLTAAAVIAAIALSPAAAAADGPHEPNETAAMATIPVTAPRIDAALETKQDEDWYLLHPQGIRQIGLLATLGAPCGSSYGRVIVDVLDGESARVPFESLQLGYDTRNPKVTATTASTVFTSEIGHRYLVHVTQSSCHGVPYSLSLAPIGALGVKLAPTKECATASRARGRATSKLKQLRTARRRARGKKRKALGTKIQLQTQKVTQAKADEASICARPPLVGYPWE